jgi:inhibitor of KinA
MSGVRYDEPRFQVSGDRVLLVALGDGIDLRVNEAVRALTERLRRDPPRGMEVVLPAYRSLAVVYDPLATTPAALETAVRRRAGHLDGSDIPPPSTVEIPVCYGDDFGPDIGFVAEHNRIDVPDVIAIHTANPYHIYTIGFAPGFCYLGGLDPRLHTPRLETPRTSVPAGAVGIAEAQTGIYPLQSPGGWRLIGRTPLKLFDARRKDPFLYQAGDSLQFVAISVQTYRQLHEKEAG